MHAPTLLLCKKMVLPLKHLSVWLDSSLPGVKGTSPSPEAQVLKTIQASRADVIICLHFQPCLIGIAPQL